MTNIQHFVFEGEILVRTVVQDGEPWFVAADLCNALGLTNATETTRTLDADEKGLSTVDTLGGPQQATVVSESGMFALIFKSRKPNAIKFRKWVTGEVLPALRKTGSYSMAAGAQPPFSGPCEGWSLAEWRVALARVNTSRATFNEACAAWEWERLGMPMPPAKLLPAWRQNRLYLTVESL